MADTQAEITHNLDVNASNEADDRPEQLRRFRQEFQTDKVPTSIRIDLHLRIDGAGGLDEGIGRVQRAVEPGTQTQKPTGGRTGDFKSNNV